MSNLPDKNELEKIKQGLLKRKYELETDLSGSLTTDTPEGQISDPTDAAISSIMENLKNSLQDTELGEYNRILSALKMIEDGTYGICADCGQAISPKRLQSFPNAIRCVGCQEEFEEKG